MTAPTTPEPEITDADRLKHLASNWGCIHLRGPDMSGKNWSVRIPSTWATRAVVESHLTLNDCIDALIKAERRNELERQQDNQP